MPYIKAEKRKAIDDVIDQLSLASEGEVNYAITTLVRNWVKQQSLVAGKFSYELGNKAMGILASVKAEFYRRVMVPYEEAKRTENGDVY